MAAAPSSLFEKIESLTPGEIAQVEQLIDAMRCKEHYRGSLALSELAFAKVWDDPENDAYDAL